MATAAAIQTGFKLATRITGAKSRTENMSVSRPLVVRALYDYHSSDPTDLSFQAGTLIRVVTKLQTRWYGCIDDKRGWFPFKYVTEIESSGNLPSF